MEGQERVFHLLVYSNGYNDWSWFCPKPGVRNSESHIWVAGDQALWSSCTAFPGTLTGSYIGSRIIGFELIFHI